MRGKFQSEIEAGPADRAGGNANHPSGQFLCGIVDPGDFAVEIAPVSSDR